MSFCGRQSHFVRRLKTDSVCGQCPPGWKWFQNGCYYFSEATQNWLVARSWCLNKGAQLVIVNTKEEQNRITSRVYWLGMTDQNVEQEWYWVDGSPVKLSFWSTGEPNDYRGEDCGTIAIDGRWNDISCHMTDYWICEKLCPSEFRMTV
uniref:C-type lectin domain-containing protein n=1 Tax=Pelusios castaneus TaxID=367368 RepID=A0A8C8RHX9_9SAUR